MGTQEKDIDEVITEITNNDPEIIGLKAKLKRRYFLFGVPLIFTVVFFILFDNFLKSDSGPIAIIAVLAILASYVVVLLVPLSDRILRRQKEIMRKFYRNRGVIK